VEDRQADLGRAVGKLARECHLVLVHAGQRTLSVGGAAGVATCDLG
jgi:hypothetical protein